MYFDLSIIWHCFITKIATDFIFLVIEVKQFHSETIKVYIFILYLETISIYPNPKILSIVRNFIANYFFNNENKLRKKCCVKEQNRDF